MNLYYFIIYLLSIILVTVITLTLCINNTKKNKTNVFVLDTLQEKTKQMIREKYPYPKSKFINFKEISKINTGIVILKDIDTVRSLNTPGRGEIAYIENRYKGGIPRIIHQVYLGYSGPMPKEWQEYHEIWKTFAKEHDWEVKLWNAQDCIDLIKESEYPEFLEMYEKYKYGVQKADAIRYFILYKYGGIYSDLDVYPIQNIQPMIEMYEQHKRLNSLFCQSPQDRVVSNWFMIAKPQAKIFLKCIQLLMERHNKKKVNKHFTVLWSTGPIMVKEAIRQYDKIDEVYIIPKEILTSCTFCNETCDNRFALLVNDQSGTWNTSQTKGLNKLTCAMEPMKNLTWLNWAIIVTCILVVVFILLIIILYMYNKCKQTCS